jgi:hypothetical protein
VIWSYIELFADAELSKLILNDQPPVLASNPNWTEEELSESGAIFDAQQLFNTIAILREGSGEEFVGQYSIFGLVRRQHRRSRSRLSEML